MTLKLYGLRACSTCRTAIAWLDERERAHDFIDVRAAGLDQSRIAAWSIALGGWEKLINRAGSTWRRLPEGERAGLTEAKARALVLRHRALIRRPLIEHGNGSVTVGFSDKIKARLT